MMGQMAGDGRLGAVGGSVEGHTAGNSVDYKMRTFYRQLVAIPTWKAMRDPGE